ncbi:Hypothetical protein D9617_12g037320 [Elsinoe fawcettii]|nr:Hypothetical protein D9617_12g037320 [Elsinoe fawcettii]
MGIFAQLKKKKASERRQTADLASKKPFTPGSYGTFPNRFTFHIASVSPAADTTCLTYLCHQTDSGLTPFLAFTGYNGFGKRALTLHSTLDPTSGPLACVGVGNFRGSSRVMKLPAPPGAMREGKDAAIEIKFEDKGNLLRERFRFECPLVATDGLPQRAHVFEWRPVDLLSGPVVRRLHRFPDTVAADKKLDGEIVAVFTQGTFSLGKGNSPGTVEFQGTGASGE